MFKEIAFIHKWRLFLCYAALSMLSNVSWNLYLFFFFLFPFPKYLSRFLLASDLLMFAYCCLHIHSEFTLSYNYYHTYTPLRSLPILSRSTRNSIERIYEKVECNCLVEGSYCTGCVMCNNFVIVVAKTQSEPGLLAQTYCYRRLLALPTWIPSRMHITLSWRDTFFALVCDSSCIFYFLF
jgi:hypothetical protein